MARLFHHSFPGSKAAFFFLEQSLILVFVLMGAPLAVLILVDGWGDWLFGAGPISTQPRLAALAVGLASRLPRATSWAIFTMGCSAMAMYAVELYDIRKAIADRTRGSRRALIALALVAAGLAIRAGAGGEEEKAFALGALVAAALAVAATRKGVPSLLGPPIRILVVGAGPRAARVATDVSDAEARVEIVRVDDSENLLSKAKASGVDWIVMAKEELPSEAELKHWVEARVAGFSCLTPAMLHERLLQRIPVDELHTDELAFSEGFDFLPRASHTKRMLDVALASLGLILALPILCVAAAAVRLDSRGPAFFRQERVGKDGRTFTLYKLRTMREGAEQGGGPRWASEADPRVTRVGRFLRKVRADEIPQLWSVLKGEMSFVGPRPERPFFVGWLEKEIPWYRLRLSTRPGLTGWAQLKFPYGASAEDAKRKLEYDLYYIKNASVFLDLAIVFHTVRHVVLARGSR